MLLGSLLAWAAIPWAPGFVAADLDLGLFYIFAVSSMVVIGILMAGWASNNKWALYGAARGAAQMVSYEIPLALAAIPVVMYTGSLNTQDIVIAQQGGIWNWYRLAQPVPVRGLLHVLHRLDRRDQPRALRHAGDRIGAGGRLPHRVHGHALRLLLPGRVRQPVPGRR